MVDCLLYLDDYHDTELRAFRTAKDEEQLSYLWDDNQPYLMQNESPNKLDCCIFCSCSQLKFSSRCIDHDSELVCEIVG